MQLLGIYPWICEQRSALPIRWSIILYLVKSITCQPYATNAMIGNGSYYMNGDIVCLKCPAGTFVRKDCVISNTQGICQTCNPGVTYSEHQTGLNHCLTCTRCRADQEEVSSCNITKNTICQCKNGTYCPTTSPCYECLPCRTSCPVEQVLQQACNATSDIVCVPVTSHLTVWIIVLFFVIIGSFIFASSAVVFLYVLKHRPFKILTINCYKTPSQDIEKSFLPERAQLRFKGNLPENEKMEAIFNYFLQLVPTKEFERFVRELGLTNIEIEKHDNTVTYNQHCSMLLKLHQNKKFDVNIWLDKLYDIKMGKVAQNITEKLIRDGLCEIST